MLNKHGKKVNGKYLGQIYWVDENAGKSSGRPQAGKISCTSDDLQELKETINTEVERLQVKTVTVKDVSFYSKI